MQILFDDEGKIVNSIVDFIQEGQNNGESTLIISMKGVNRSVCALLAFFMSEYKWSLGKSKEYMHWRRPAMKISPSFLFQLEALEYQLRSNKKGGWIDQWKYEQWVNEQEQIAKNTFFNSKTTVQLKEKRVMTNLNLLKRDNIKLKWLDHISGGRLSTFIVIPNVKKNFKISSCFYNSPVKNQIKINPMANSYQSFLQCAKGQEDGQQLVSSIGQSDLRPNQLCNNSQYIKSIFKVINSLTYLLFRKCFIYQQGSEKQFCKLSGLEQVKEQKVAEEECKEEPNQLIEMLNENDIKQIQKEFIIQEEKKINFYDDLYNPSDNLINLEVNSFKIIPLNDIQSLKEQLISNQLSQNQIINSQNGSNINRVKHSSDSLAIINQIVGNKESIEEKPQQINSQSLFILEDITTENTSNVIEKIDDDNQLNIKDQERIKKDYIKLDQSNEEFDLDDLQSNIDMSKQSSSANQLKTIIFSSPLTSRHLKKKNKSLQLQPCLNQTVQNTLTPIKGIFQQKVPAFSKVIRIIVKLNDNRNKSLDISIPKSNLSLQSKTPTDLQIANKDKIFEFKPPEFSRANICSSRVRPSSMDDNSSPFKQFQMKQGIIQKSIGNGVNFPLNITDDNNLNVTIPSINKPFIGSKSNFKVYSPSLGQNLSIFSKQPKITKQNQKILQSCFNNIIQFPHPKVNIVGLQSQSQQRQFRKIKIDN